MKITRVIVPALVLMVAVPLCAQDSPVVAAAKTNPKSPAAQRLSADAATREQVFKLFEVLHLRRTMTLMMDGMKQAMRQGAEQSFRQQIPDPTPEQLQFLDGIADDTFSEFSIDELVDAVVPIYQRHFTKADIDGILAFYASPVGQKLLQEQPQVLQESMQAGSEIGRSKMVAISDKIQKRVAEFVASQKKSSGPKQ